MACNMLRLLFPPVPMYIRNGIRWVPNLYSLWVMVTSKGKAPDLLTIFCTSRHACRYTEHSKLSLSCAHQKFCEIESRKGGASLFRESAWEWTRVASPALFQDKLSLLHCTMKIYNLAFEVAVSHRKLNASNTSALLRGLMKCPGLTDREYTRNIAAANTKQNLRHFHLVH